MMMMMMMPLSVILYAILRVIAKKKLCTKFEVSTSTGFGDIVEGVPHFLGIT